MEKISKPNRRRKFDAKGRRELDMPMDGASVRDVERIQRKRAKNVGSFRKKGAK